MGTVFEIGKAKAAEGEGWAPLLISCLPYLACTERNTFLTSEHQNRYKLRSCQSMCKAFTYLLDNSFIRFDTKLYRRIVGIPMITNCAYFFFL